MMIYADTPCGAAADMALLLLRLPMSPLLTPLLLMLMAAMPRHFRYALDATLLRSHC